MRGYLKSMKNIPNLRWTCDSPHKANIIVWTLLLMLIFPVTAATTSIRGAKEIDIGNNFLEQHITQLKHPRLLTIDDITRDYEKYEIEGYSFLLKGDFNKDGHNDYAVAGRYDGPSNEELLFVCILTAKNDIITVEYIHQILFPHDRVFLSLESGTKYTVKNVNKRYDIIKVAMALGTDWVWIIAWDGKKYIRSDKYEYGE